MQTVMNHLNTNFGRTFDVNASSADVLADELGKRQSLDERWETWRTEKCAFVERVILNGGDYEGMSLLSIICNTTGHNGVSEHEIDKQLMAHMKVMMAEPDSKQAISAAIMFNHILREQITEQVKERIDLEVQTNRIKSSWRSL